MTPADTLMTRAVSGGVFPGGVLLVARADSVIFLRAYGYANLFSETQMTEATIFDLASLTKPLATALAVMHLVEQRKLDLEQSIGSILPRFDHPAKGRIRLKHLLYHNSGLPDYSPYYARLRRLPESSRAKALNELLAKEALVYPVGECMVYSDLGFMLLRRAVEQVSGQRMDRFVTERIYRPLGLADLFFVSRDAEPIHKPFAATERCPWRQIVLQGLVHDDNAYVVGGIEGHAGLFGSAEEVHRLLAELLGCYHGRHCAGVFERKTVSAMFERQPDTGRGLGFDTPSLTDSSAGRFFSPHSVGHLGFTGTSFWMDLERSVIVVLLTNRVHPTRYNNKIRAFRPELHDAVMESLR